jgi:cytoskeletal protein CcmA (bactofilin family)
MAKKDMIIEDVSIISSSVRIEGNIFSDGNVRIDGSVNGNVSVHGNLTIGDTSKLNGEIQATNVTMNGKLTGKVRAEEKLRLESKAFLSGDLITKILIIEEGAVFQGNSKMEQSS